MKFHLFSFRCFLYLLSSFDVYAGGNLKKCKESFEETKASFEKTIQNYEGKDYQVIAPKGRTILDLKEVLGKEDQVFLGIAKDTYYLHIGGFRLRTVFYFFKSPNWSKNEKVSNGYLIHFPDIPKEKILAWKEKIDKQSSKNSRAISCVSKSCSVLKDEFGIKINGNTINLLMGSTLKKILKKGFVDVNGKPVPIQILQMSSRVPEFSSLVNTLTMTDAIWVAWPFIMLGLLFL